MAEKEREEATSAYKRAQEFERQAAILEGSGKQPWAVISAYTRALHEYEKAQDYFGEAKAKISIIKGIIRKLKESQLPRTLRESRRVGQSEEELERKLLI